MENDPGSLRGRAVSPLDDASVPHQQIGLQHDGGPTKAAYAETQFRDDPIHPVNKAANLRCWLTVRTSLRST
jgi:hypothetical protein